MEIVGWYVTTTEQLQSGNLLDPMVNALEVENTNVKTVIDTWMKDNYDQSLEDYCLDMESAGYGRDFDILFTVTESVRGFTACWVDSDAEITTLMVRFND